MVLLSVPAPATVTPLRQEGPRGWWRRLPRRWRRAIVAALVLRITLAVAAFVFGGLLPGLGPVSVQPVPGTSFQGWTALAPHAQGYGLLWGGLARFDALWYLAIAAFGYPAVHVSIPQAAAFFPGFPALVAIVGRLLGSFYAGGQLIAMVATVIGLAGIHRLVEDETGDTDTARRALVAAAVFPSAFFLVAPFTESLFLAASTWALVYSRRGRWMPTAAAAVLVGLTRNVGALLALPMLIEAVRQRSWRGLVASAGAPVGLGLYLGFSWLWFGTPLAPVSVQGGWERTFHWPWQSVWTAVRYGVQTPGAYATGYHSLNVLVFVPIVAAIVWLFRRTPPAFAWYALAHVLVWLVYPFPDRPLMSTPRFALAVAPLFWAFGSWMRSRTAETIWIAASSALLGVQFLLFVGWYYIF